MIQSENDNSFACKRSLPSYRVSITVLGLGMPRKYSCITCDLQIVEDVVLLLYSLLETIQMIDPKISHELTAFSNDLRQDHQDFMCVYGSSAYPGEDRTSDIDIFIVTDNPKLRTPAFLERFTQFVIDLHVRHNRLADEEVPYENKLLYTHDEVRGATTLGCFIVNPDLSVQVPHVEKNPTFLSSPALKSRLLLNALTTPHLVIDETPTYKRHRNAAEIAITALGISLSKQSIFTSDSVYESLIASEDGREGEMYLGYKISYPDVREYLFKVIENSLHILNDEQLLTRRDKLYIKSHEFNPVQIAHYFTYNKATR